MGERQGDRKGGDRERGGEEKMGRGRERAYENNIYSYSSKYHQLHFHQLPVKPSGYETMNGLNNWCKTFGDILAPMCNAMVVSSLSLAVLSFLGNGLGEVSCTLTIGWDHGRHEKETVSSS